MDSIINKVKLPNSSTEYGITDVRIGTSAVSSPTHVLGYNSSDADTIGSVAISDLVSSTDTKNTAGATDSSAKLFLIGATTQSTNPQTYSQDTAYVDTDGCLYSGGNKVITDISSKADLASPAFTGTPTAPTAAAGTNTTQIATTAFVNAAFQANDAMVFKGTIGTGGTVTSLPTTHYQGWTYKVITADTYAGAACEVGDMIICITDGTSANNDHWTVVQSNVDGIVTGPASSTTDHVVTFNGTTGKVVKDSGYTIATSVPANAVFTDTTYESKSASSGGTAVSLVTTGEKYNWDNKQASVAKLGSTTKPVYTSAAGTFAECSSYAGGTAVTLNGSSKAASTASFYAPTTYGTSGYYLKANGSGVAPTWTSFPTIPSVTLNGSSSTSPSFYAPAAGGTSGQYLKSNGSSAPTWNNFPTIPSISLNGSSTTSSSFYAPTTAGTSGYYLKSNGSGAPTWTAFPTIPSKMSDVATISVVAVTADTSSSCSITGSGNAGKSETIIYTNSSGSDKVVTVPTTYTTPTGEAIELTCPDGGYCEVNYLNISGTIYARGL